MFLTSEVCKRAELARDVGNSPSAKYSKEIQREILTI
jgi:hypothetical protein